MTIYTLERKPLKDPDFDIPEAGAIRDARRHRRRERVAGSLLFLASIGTALFLLVARDAVPASLAKSSRPTWLAGAPLSKPTHLRLLVSENGGPASIVDVDDQRVKAVPGLALPRKPSLWSSMMWPLVKVSGGALGVVTRRDCNSCTGTETHFLISPTGSVRRIGAFTLAADQYSTTPVLGSASASWVLTHPRRVPCTLTAQPGSPQAVTVPCGDLVADTPAGSDTPAGLIISTSNRMVLINPRTGHVRERSPVHGLLDVLSRTVALTSGRVGITEQGGTPPHLTLVNLTTGVSTELRWPSMLRYGYEIFPDPRSSMVAVDFRDPAYAGTQASDVWLLNTRTDAFTHVPGFPILEHLKFSGIAWTTDHRLVIVAQGGGRTAIGIWRPGTHQLHVSAIPALTGYTELVPFVR
jgi:hypothetical protein